VRLTFLLEHTLTWLLLGSLAHRSPLGTQLGIPWCTTVLAKRKKNCGSAEEEQQCKNTPQRWGIRDKGPGVVGLVSLELRLTLCTCGWTIPFSTRPNSCCVSLRPRPGFDARVLNREGRIKRTDFSPNLTDTAATAEAAAAEGKGFSRALLYIL
jgi:hypothetical protein